MAHHEHHEPLSDERLLQNIVQRCEDCFRILFIRYFRDVLSIAHRIVRDLSEAEDILQEVFLAVFLRQEQYDPAKGSVRTWILQFAYYKSMLRRRYLCIRNFYKREELETALETRASGSCDRAFGLNANEWIQFVEQGLAALPAIQQRTIELVHFEGRTLLGTSQITGESLASTRNNYYRGMKKLRTHLQLSEKGENIPSGSQPAATVPR